MAVCLKSCSNVHLLHFPWIKFSSHISWLIAPLMFPSMTCNDPVPFVQKQLCGVMLPPSYFPVGVVVLRHKHNTTLNLNYSQMVLFYPTRVLTTPIRFYDRTFSWDGGMKMIVRCSFFCSSCCFQVILQLCLSVCWCHGGRG